MTTQKNYCKHRQSLNTTFSSCKLLSSPSQPYISGFLRSNTPTQSQAAYIFIHSSHPSLHHSYSHLGRPSSQSLLRCRRSSDVADEVLNKTVAEPTAVQSKSETEKELDELERMLMPRRVRRGSACTLPCLPLPTEEPKPVRQCVWLDISLESGANIRKKEAMKPKCYINLAKLPFGKHSSYNDETNIRTKIVSKRWKAYLRDNKPKPPLKDSL